MRIGRGAVGLVLAILSVFILLSSGLGHRLGIWGFVTGLKLFMASGVVGVVSVVAVLIACFLNRGRFTRVLAVQIITGAVLGLSVVGVTLYWRNMAHSVPRIHDISTDTQRPPEFVAILPLRANASNQAAYGGPTVAVLQRRAYPDIGPKVVPAPPDEAFASALLAAERMGWEIADADAKAGRIEATDTTLWFGFKDDVVVRVEPVDGGSRIDVRSVSRVGVSDVGTNARRIRNYLEMLNRR